LASIFSAAHSSLLYIAYRHTYGTDDSIVSLRRKRQSLPILSEGPGVSGTQDNGEDIDVLDKIETGCLLSFSGRLLYTWGVSIFVLGRR